MDQIQALRVAAKLLSVSWGSVAVFWSFRFLALWPVDDAYRLLPITVASYAAAFGLFGAARFLPQRSSPRPGNNGWTTRLLQWADDL